MRQIHGQWQASKAERTRYIKELISKGYTNDQAIDILDKRLQEYNPLGLTMDEMIARTI